MSTSTSQERPLKILIVGGGIAGLTLANALQHAPVNIEYLLLEARNSLAPQLGAGIALLPNGSRILDQLGVYADLEPGIDPVVSSSVLDARGRPLLPERTDGAKLLGIRMSYPLAMIQRRSLLQSLESRLQHDKGRVLTGKKVLTVEQDKKGATVYCADGSSYHADIVVGADGVRSKVREEMWRASRDQGTGKIDVGKERSALTAEYNCIFGISKAVAGLGPGTTDDTWARDKALSVHSGERGKLFWLLYSRMDRVYGFHEIPRYDADDATRLASENLDMPLRPSGKATFADVWNAREVATMLALEEGAFSHWTAGRIVCLGDSVHKMTPHTGAGGMLAIETAAALANALCRLAAESGTATLSQVEAALRQYEFGSNNLHGRASENIKKSGDLARLSALHTRMERILVPYLVPLSLDSRVDLFCDMAVGAPHIEYLPVPPRSMKGTMPFNPSHGMTKHERLWHRVVVALPIVVVAIASALVIFGLIPFEQIREVLDHGVYRPGNGDAEIPLMQRFYRIPFIDNVTRIYNLEFVIGGANCFYLMLNLFAEYGVWYAITLIESTRRANHLTILTPILVWGMFNLGGIALFGALWKFFHYILSPMSVFDASDMRLTDKTFTGTVLPTLLISHYSTFLSAYLAPDLTRRQMAAHLWPLFPLWIWLGQKVALRYFLKPSTVSRDRLYNVTSDLAVIRQTIGVLVAVSATAWQYTLWCGGRSSLVDEFLPAVPILHVSDLSFEGAYVEFLKWEWVFFVLGNLVWIVLLAWDLKASGMVRMSWLALVSCGICLTLVGGHGALLGLAWLYREEVLVSRRHKDAVVPKST